MPVIAQHQLPYRGTAIAGPVQKQAPVDKADALHANSMRHSPAYTQYCSRCILQNHLRVPPLPGDDPLLLIRGLQSHHSGGNEPLPLIDYVRCVEHGRMAQVSPYHTVCIVEGNFTYGAGGSVIHDEEDQDWGYIHIAGHDCLGVTQGYQQMGPIQKLGLQCSTQVRSRFWYVRKWF